MSFLSRRQRSSESIRQPRTDLQAAESLFRRSRTLTGSLSSRVRAASEQQSQLRSPRLKDHDLRRHRRKIVAALGIMLAFSGAVAWLIDQMIVSPSYQVATADAPIYRGVVDEYLARHPFERVFALLNQKTLNDFVVAERAEVRSVNVSDMPGLFAGQKIVVVERTAIARWQLGEKLYFVDADGVAFEKVPSQQPTLSVKDESGLPPASQTTVASRTLMNYIGRVVGGVSAGVGTVKEVIIPPAMLKEVVLVLEGRSYRLRLNTDRDPAGQVADIKNALRYLDGAGITPEYVDLRVAGKAFYK